MDGIEGKWLSLNCQPRENERMFDTMTIRWPSRYVMYLAASGSIGDKTFESIYLGG